MWARTEEILPYALLLPSLVFLALLILIPMVQALLFAIQADSGEFTTAYLQRMAVDVNFNDAWRNTLLLIPRDFFEAADLFRANRLRRTLYVVLPLLRPSLQSALIIRTIFAFQTFAVVLALAGRNMPVIAAEAYSWYANNRDAHLAASYALLLLGLTIVFTFVYLRVLGLREAEVKR